MDQFTDDAFIFTMVCVAVITAGLFTHYLTGSEFVTSLSILAGLWHFGDWRRGNQAQA